MGQILGEFHVTLEHVRFAFDVFPFHIRESVFFIFLGKSIKSRWNGNDFGLAGIVSLVLNEFPKRVKGEARE